MVATVPLVPQRWPTAESCSASPRRKAGTSASRRNATFRSGRTALWGGGQSGEPVGERDHMHGLGTTADRILVELVLATPTSCCAWQTQWHSVGDREAVAAGRGFAVRRLRRVDDDQPLRGDEHPGAVAEVALLDPQAEQVLGDRLDRHGDLVRGEGGEVLRPELVRAWVRVSGRRGLQRNVRVTIKIDSILPNSPGAHTALTARSA